MSNPNADKPHRVAYHPRGSGGPTTKVFPTLEKANEFAASDAVRIVIIVQPASDPPPVFNKNRMKDRGLERVPCETCNGRRRRLKSEQYCVECSGRNYEAQRTIRLVADRRQNTISRSCK